MAALNNAYEKADVAVREELTKYYQELGYGLGGYGAQPKYDGMGSFDITKLLKGDPDDGKSGNN